MAERKQLTTTTDEGIHEHSQADAIRYHFLYAGLRWQRVRDIALRRCPICARCDLVISAIVDHIVPSGVAIQQARDSGLYMLDRYAGFYFMSNLHGLCRACHYLKTIEDKTHTGPWPDVVDKEQHAPRKKYVFV
jgi:5-methylcytosine-specific restriction endonuclease McrA